MGKPVGKLSKTEFARQMARREIVFQRPTRYWQAGLSIGNGDFQGAVYGGGAEMDGVIGIALSKVDVWDERYDRKGHRYHTVAELRQLVADLSGTEEGRKQLNSIEPYGMVGQDDWYRRSYPYAYAPPTPKPSGVLRVDLGATLETFEERLSIHRGEVTFTLGDEQQGATLSTFVDANTNVMALQVERHGRYERPIAFQLARYIDEQLGEPEVGVEGNAFWHRYVFPDGSTYAVYGVLAEGKVEAGRTAEGDWADVEARTAWAGGGYMRIHQVELQMKERQATLTLHPDASAAVVFVGVATSKEGADPLARAKELALAAARKGLKAVREKHLDWWEAFWRKSSLVLSDRMVESLWYHGLYLLACQSRGGTLPSLQGPGYQLPHGGWNGTLLTNYNLQMTYWPTFISNHL